MAAQDFALNVANYDPGTYNQGNFFERVGDYFSGRDRATEYNQRAAYLDKLYEQDSLTAARAWSEYMDSTQIQRRVKDLEAAGLNKWLAVNNGLSSSAGNSVGDGGSAKNYSKAKNGSNAVDDIKQWIKDLMNFSIQSAKVATSFLSGD